MIKSVDQKIDTMKKEMEANSESLRKDMQDVKDVQEKILAALLKSVKEE